MCVLGGVQLQACKVTTTLPRDEAQRGSPSGMGKVRRYADNLAKIHGLNYLNRTNGSRFNS